MDSTTLWISVRRWRFIAIMDFKCAIDSLNPEKSLRANASRNMDFTASLGFIPYIVLGFHSTSRHSRFHSRIKPFNFWTSSRK